MLHSSAFYSLVIFENLPSNQTGRLSTGGNGAICRVECCEILHVNMTTLLNSQALQIDPANTKALYRRAQGWQGIKDLDQALVIITVFNNYYYFNLNI